MKKRECDGTGSFTIRKSLNRLLMGVAVVAAAVLVIPSMPQEGMMEYVEAEETNGSISDNTTDNPPTKPKPGNTGNSNNGNNQEQNNNNNNITNNNGDSRIINNDDRAEADEDMLYYMQSLEVRYHLDAKVMEKLHKVFDSAVYYIANTDMTVAELWAYVSTTKSDMNSAAVATVTATTSEFLQVGDNWETPTVSAGQKVSIVLPVINFGTEELNDLIIEPKTSTVVSEWPFEPDMTNYLQTEPFIPGNKTTEGSSPLLIR